MRQSVNTKGGEGLTYRIEPSAMRHDARFLSLMDAVDTLTEVSIAALTTDPDLRDVGRSLISLVRYHAQKTESGHGVAMQRPFGARAPSA